MPISADHELRLRTHYKLPTLQPTAWPFPDDDDSSDDDNDTQTQATSGAPARHTSKLSVNSNSKYRNIGRHASLRSTPADSESVVQKDEPDPLGMAASVASELKRKGLPVEDNIKYRNRFLLSSTSFSPSLFLSQVHQDASTEDLLRGLDYLSQSIEQKSASLKVLVESNFEKFVKAKATIDNVYTSMRSQGADANGEPQSPRKTHSRVTSRNQTHFRNTSGAFSPTANNKPLPSDKKKNALTKESEYGVQGIKAPLVEVAIKAEEVWGPALGGREKEETLKSVLSNIEQNRGMFKLSGDLRESIRKNDYDNVVEAYKQAIKHADQARHIASTAQSNNTQLSDGEAQQIIITAKMWHEVTQQLDAFKREVWRRLKSSHGSKATATVADEADKEQHLLLIGVLIQLGVDENPIWEWLHSRYIYLKSKIGETFERARVEIEILRRKLSTNNDNTDAQARRMYLRSVVHTSPSSQPDATAVGIDSPAVIAFWEKVQASLTALLSSQGGVVGEVLEYWQTTQSFIDNRAQKSFPTAVFAAGSEHLELEPDDVANLRSGAVELVQLIRESVKAFFEDPPVEDLSELYSPIPPTPSTPDTASALTPGAKARFNFDPTTIPPSPTKRGESWEKFAFWPPQANSLSGSLYLSRILTLVGTAASELAALGVVKQARATEALKSLVGAVRERCLQAVCAAWNTDAERCKVLETWVRDSARRDLTTMPAAFVAFEESVLGNTQKIAYISEAMSTRGSAEVVVPPSAKLLQTLRSCFVTSLYKALSGMVENAEAVRKDNVSSADPDGVTVAKSGGGVNGVDSTTLGVDARNRNIRLLLTLSNLAHLRAEIIPHLISQFETLFSVTLTSEKETLRDVLSQIEARLFNSYIQPTVSKLDAIISEGITSPGWIPQTARPTDAKPYVYDVLLTLVLVHTEITSSAGTPLLATQILSHLLTTSSSALLSAFSTRPSYSLPSLMQATLDVEFMAQTLNNYSSEKAGEVQSQIYLALDERTNDEARHALQSELPEMRAALKRLREGRRGEFGCFRRERGRGRGGTGGK